MLLSDKTIKELCQGHNPMLTPFTPESISKLETGHPTTSYGLSSFGYDLRLGNNFKTLMRPENLPGARFIDPTAFDQTLLADHHVEDGFVFVVPPQACVLAVTKERIIMPPDVSGVCMQKSTIARSFLEVTVTPLEAGWEGYLTLELHNKTPYPIHLRPGMGIVQLLFYKGDQPCEVPYGARNGKYNNQPAYPVAARSMADGPVGDTSELGILSERTFARTSNQARENLKTVDCVGLTRDFMQSMHDAPKAEDLTTHLETQEPVPTPAQATSVEDQAGTVFGLTDSIHQQFQKIVGDLNAVSQEDRTKLVERVTQGILSAKERLANPEYTKVEVNLEEAVRESTANPSDVIDSIVKTVLNTGRRLTEDYMNELVDSWAHTNKELLAFGTNVSGHKSAEAIDETARYLKNAYRAQQKAKAEPVAPVAAPVSTSVPASEYAAAEAQLHTSPFEELREALVKDEEYAWSWYANIAMPIYDSLPAEINDVERLHMARYAAFVLMQHIFKIDIASSSIAKHEKVPTVQAGLAVTLALNARSGHVTEEAVLAALTSASTQIPTSEQVADIPQGNPASVEKFTYEDLKKGAFQFQPLYCGPKLNGTMSHSEVLLSGTDRMYFSVPSTSRHGTLRRDDMPNGVFDMLYGVLLVQFIYQNTIAVPIGVPIIQAETEKACAQLIELGSATSSDPAHLLTAQGLLVVAERLETVLTMLGLQLPTNYGELVQYLRAQVISTLSQADA